MLPESENRELFHIQLLTLRFDCVLNALTPAPRGSLRGGEDKMTRIHTLYAAAVEADENFSAALVSAYGKDACNLRYKMGAHDSADVEVTKALFLVATSEYLAACKTVQS